MNYTTKEELNNRIKALQTEMKGNDLDGVLIIHKVNMYYFSGTSQDGVLFIPQGGSPYLLIKRNYERAREESKLDNIIPLKNINILSELLKQFGFNHLSKLAFEQDVIPVEMFFKLKKIFPSSLFEDASTMTKNLRSFKSKYEIDIMRRAAEINRAGYDAIKKGLHEGVSELELAIRAESAMRNAGHEKNLRMRREGVIDYLSALILSGTNATNASYLNTPLAGIGLSPAVAMGSSNKKIFTGDPVIADLSSSYYGYTVDMTRTFAIKHLPKEITKAYDLSLKILHWIRDNLKPGVSTEDLYNAALAIANETPYGEYFMGYDDNKVFFIGHGVGLECDEPPYLAKGYNFIIKPGITIAVEPKIKFPSVGAVGVENTYLITDQGAECLTDISEEIVFVKK